MARTPMPRWCLGYRRGLMVGMYRDARETAPLDPRESRRLPFRACAQTFDANFARPMVYPTIGGMSMKRMLGVGTDRTPMIHALPAARATLAGALPVRCALRNSRPTSHALRHLRCSLAGGTTNLRCHILV